MNLTMTQKAEYERDGCFFSKEWLFTRHYVIKGKNGELQLMSPLRLAQRKLIALIQWVRGKKEPVRIIIGKSRKTGISTVVEADMHDEVCERGIDGLIVANEADLSEYIFDMTRRFHEYRDKVFQKEVVNVLNPSIVTEIWPISKPALYKGKTNKREMRFQGREGRIEVETARNMYAGTGRTPQYIHETEGAKYERGADMAISLHQSMGYKAGTTYIKESTFNGYDGFFLPYWENAYNNARVTFTADERGFLAPNLTVMNGKEWNRYLPMFVSVLDDEDARLPFASEDEKQAFLTTLDERERTVKERNPGYLGIDEFLNWYRFALKNMCQNEETIRSQEYPITPEEAIISSGRPRFQVRKLDLMPIEEGEKGMFREVKKGWEEKVTWIRDPQEWGVRFRDRQPGHRYIVSADPAEGRLDEYGKDPDASVVHVLDLDACGEQVFCLAGQISEENLVEPMLLIAEYYNQAYVIVESNSTGKHVCIELSRRYPPNRLYHRDDWDLEKSRMSREVGYRTHIGNKSHLIGFLADAINDAALLIHDRRTLMECKRYVFQSAGGTGPEKGYHDDHVMALALGVHAIRYYPEHRMNANPAMQYWQAMQKRRRQGLSAITGY